MHVDTPQEFPIECAMALATAARNGTVFDTPRESFTHAWNLLGWGGGTFLPEEGFGSAGAASAQRPLAPEEREALTNLKTALEGSTARITKAPAGDDPRPVYDFFLDLLAVLLAQLNEWLGGLLG